MPSFQQLLKGAAERIAKRQGEVDDLQRNLSLAVLKSHPLHRRSLILKRHGGSV